MQKIAVVAAGGTGGHLFPAQALSEVLISRGWRIVLASDERGAAYAGNFPAEEVIGLSARSFKSGDPVGMLLAGLGLLGNARGLYRLAVENAKPNAERTPGYQERDRARIEGGVHKALYAAQREELAALAPVRELIELDVKRVNERFSRVENIRKFLILEKELDHDDGELTATQKVRRSIIGKKFAREIELIYGGGTA